MKEINIAIIGYGTVGQGVVAVLNQNAEEIRRRTGYSIHIKTVAKRSWKNIDTSILPFHCTDNPEEIVNDPEISAVIELIGGIEPARSLIIKSIKNQKHIITANKALIAKHGDELFQLAQQNGVSISYEASVAGGIPVIKVLREAMGANQIKTLAGIINGTCNFILTAMKDENAEFSDALSAAQKLGYAEADPSLDINGTDAAHKLTILASLAFGIPLQFDRVFIEGIENIEQIDIQNAKDLGFVIKHLGIAIRRSHGLELRVHPTLIPENEMLASVSNVMNALQIDGNAVGKTLYYGSGAGKFPTASAVVADLIDTIRDFDDDRDSRIAPLGYTEITSAGNLELLDENEFFSAFYLRATVKDEIGVLAKITNILASEEICIASIVQKTPLKNCEDSADVENIAVPLIILTDAVKEQNIRRAIEKIENLEQNLAPVQKIRVINC